MIINTTSSVANPARKAYEDAVDLFNKELTSDECDRIWLRDKVSIQDVQTAVEQARRKYHESKRSKLRKWLAKASTRILYYGTILDALADHHPEYVKLAWGALKFLFIVSMLCETQKNQC